MGLDNIELVRRVFAAFHAGDFEQVVKDSAPEIEWDASRAAPDGGVYRGLDEIRAAWARFQRAWEEHRVTIERAAEVGDDVILILREYGRGAGTGIEVDMRSADVYTVIAQKITRVVSYADPQTALREAGLAAV